MYLSDATSVQEMDETTARNILKERSEEKFILIQDDATILVGLGSEILAELDKKEEVEVIPDATETGVDVAVEPEASAPVPTPSETESQPVGV